MRFVKENTVKREVSLKGIGLHTGQPVNVTIHPASNAAGIVFHRTDLHADCDMGAVNGARVTTGVGACEHIVHADARHVISTRLGTTLRNDHGTEIATVEHLMAAFAVTGVNNAVVDICGPEVPIFDGSAEPFVTAIIDAGISPLGMGRTPITLLQPIEVRDGERFLRVEPSDCLDLDVEIGFEDTAIGRQSIFLSMECRVSRERMAMARTFCELKSVETMRAAGLGQGGSIDNAIVVDGGRLLNKDGLRDPQEFVLHKALDLLGDLALLGRPLLGRVTAYKPGHDLNNRLCRELLEAVENEALPQLSRPERRWESEKEISLNQASA